MEYFLKRLIQEGVWSPLKLAFFGTNVLLSKLWQNFVQPHKKNVGILVFRLEVGKDFGVDLNKLRWIYHKFNVHILQNHTYGTTSRKKFPVPT